jgi:hypothetical protein
MDFNPGLAPLFNAMFDSYGLLQFSIVFNCALLCYFQYFKRNLYLDAGLSNKHDVAKTENLTWLNQFGTIGTFLKNDIKHKRKAF